MSDSFCRVDTALTETVCEFLATVESRLADSFLSHGYARDVCLYLYLYEVLGPGREDLSGQWSVWCSRLLNLP